MGENDRQAPRAKRPGKKLNLCRMLCFGVAPLAVAWIAAFIGYICTTPLPAGTVFWLMHQPALFTAKLTPEVPASMQVLPRPTNEQFHQLPSGAKMPMSGLGTCCRATAYHDESVRRSVFWFLMQGGRHIDTAALYLNHKAVGLGIKDAIVRGVPRSEIFVTTKIFTTHYGEKRASGWVEEMLKELDLDYVDLVLMHAPRHNFGLWPGILPNVRGIAKSITYDEALQGWTASLSEGLWPNHENADFQQHGCETAKQCRKETWKALSDARDKGLIKELGVSNFRIYHLRELMGMKLAPVAVHQVFYHPWVPEWQQKIVDFCKENNIAVTGYMSLGGSMGKAKAFSLDTLKDIATTHERTPAIVLQRWAIHKNISVIPGSGNPAHMKENLDVFSFELSDDEILRIDALSQDPIMSYPEFLNK